MVGFWYSHQNALMLGNFELFESPKIEGQQWALVHGWLRAEISLTYCNSDGFGLPADRMRPRHRQQTVQYRHADGNFCLLRRKTPGPQTGTDERFVTRHHRLHQRRLNHNPCV